MAAPPRRPPALVDELVEEILLRVPPDDPARLVRAALVCNRWRRIVSDPGFRRRFLELHRAPPMLGFLRNLGSQSSFVSTSSFRPLRLRGHRRAARPRPPPQRSLGLGSEEESPAQSLRDLGSNHGRPEGAALAAGFQLPFQLERCRALRLRRCRRRL
ncbi:unnamed protein product [Urochloa humidicola]